MGLLEEAVAWALSAPAGTREDAIRAWEAAAMAALAEMSSACLFGDEEAHHGHAVGDLIGDAHH